MNYRENSTEDCKKVGQCLCGNYGQEGQIYALHVSGL